MIRRLLFSLLLSASWLSADSAAMAAQIVRDPARFRAAAEELGLTESQAEEVLRVLTVRGEAPPQGVGHAFAEWRERGIDVIPYLLSLLQEGSAEKLGLGIAQVFLDQQISQWLAMTDDPRAHRAVIDETKRRLAEKWQTVHEADLVGRFVSALGLIHEEEVLDLLFILQSEEFWQREDAPGPLPGSEAEEALNRKQINWKEHLQSRAVQAIATTGMERAIYALGTGEGINPSARLGLDAYFKTALTRAEGIPSVDYWRERGLPEGRLAEMQALCQWWQRAVDFGIPIEYAKHLKHALDSLIADPGRDSIDFALYKALDIDLVPFLLNLLDSEDLPRGTGYSPNQLTQSMVLGFLGQVDDVRARERLLSETIDYLEKPLTTRDDVEFLRCLLYPLLATGSEEGLDLAFALHSDDYWATPEAPEVDMAAFGDRSSDQETELAIWRIKEIAFHALEFSGTDRALQAFATGEGINPRFRGGKLLASAFDTCARARVGIVGMPEWYGRPLPKDKLRELEEIYATYGKTYVPEREREDVQRQSYPSQ